MGTRVAIEGKTIAVVGASRGLGLEFVRQFLAKGNQVIATARNPAAPGLQGLRKEHPKALRIDRLDVTDEAAIKEWAGSLRGHVSQLDYVISNAGIAEWDKLENVTAEGLIRVFKTNSVGPLLVAKELVLARLLGRGSTLANMTSKMGSVSDNTSGNTYSYRASKAALNIITKSLSIDLEDDGVTCVLLHPGWVKTDMTGNSGLITPSQSVSGLISVLESGRPLNGHWYDYKGEEIPW